MSAPTIIMKPQDPRGWRDAPTARLPGILQWGRVKTASGWYWVVSFYNDEDDSAIMDGFEATQEAAEEAARIAIMERWPVSRVATFRAKLAADRYSECHARKTQHKGWRESVKGTAWEGRPYVYRTSRWGNGEWSRTPIVSVTPRFVFALKPHHVRGLPIADDGEMEIPPDRFARKDCWRLDRAKLEEGLEVFADTEIIRMKPRYMFDPEWSAATPKTSDDHKIRILELRSIMQREHPDKGGDRERFITAQRELSRLREARP